MLASALTQTPLLQPLLGMFDLDRQSCGHCLRVVLQQLHPIHPLMRLFSKPRPHYWSYPNMSATKRWLCLSSKRDRLATIFSRGGMSYTSIVFFLGARQHGMVTRMGGDKGLKSHGTISTYCTTWTVPMYIRGYVLKRTWEEFYDLESNFLSPQLFNINQGWEFALWFLNGSFFESKRAICSFRRANKFLHSFGKELQERESLWLLF